MKSRLALLEYALTAEQCRRASGEDAHGRNQARAEDRAPLKEAGDH